MDFWDDYEHLDDQLGYILESTLAGELDKSLGEQILGCECVELCDAKFCACLARSGALYTFRSETQLKNYALTITNHEKPAYECNNNCKCCKSRCGNRLVQFGPNKNLKIFETGTSRGLGLKVTAEIDSSCFICEYAGEIIAESEAKRRFCDYSKCGVGRNYIFCINENFGAKNQKTYIDPTMNGNIGRYINHSCEPNAILVPIRILDVIPRLFIFAKKAIAKNEEVTFDYGTFIQGRNEDNSKRTSCLCGADTCRKYLPFDTNI